MLDISYRIWIFVLGFIVCGLSTYSQVSDGGTAVAAPAVVCADANSGTIALNASVGDVLFWEYSTSGSDPWVTISYQNKPLPFNNLQQTTYFRAIVQFGSTPQDTSSVAVVTVNSTTLSGELSENLELCGSGNSGTLSLMIIMVISSGGNIQIMMEYHGIILQIQIVRTHLQTYQILIGTG